MRNTDAGLSGLLSGTDYLTVVVERGKKARKPNMNPDEFITKQLEEFNRRRAMMVRHQLQAFEMLFANRAKRYWDAITQPPAKQLTLRKRAQQWLNQRVAALRKQRTRRCNAAQKKSVQVVEAEYSVIDHSTSGDG